MASDLQLALVNQALTFVGEDVLPELTGETFLGTVAIQHYDPIVEEELQSGNYLFAIKTHTPALLTQRAAEPLQYRYSLPSESMKVLSVLYGDTILNGLDFVIERDIVRARHNTLITFRYVVRPDEEKWPSIFKQIIVRRLKAVFQSALEHHDDARETERDAQTRTILARHADSFQSRNQPQQDGSIVNRRRGSARVRGL